LMQPVVLMQPVAMVTSQLEEMPTV